VIDPQEHANNRGVVESILKYIPGFSGYLSREYRRESDSLARKFMADRLQRSKRGLDAYGKTLVNLGALDSLPYIDQLRNKIDMAINRLNAQMPGYSGFFDFVQVDEGVLTDIYEHDLALIEKCETLAKDIEGLSTSTMAPLQVVPEIQDKINAVLSQIDHREDMLKGIAPGPTP